MWWRVRLKSKIYMEHIKKNLLKFSFAFWLGFSLDVLGFNMFTWQYWFVAIPTIILTIIFYRYE